MQWGRGTRDRWVAVPGGGPSSCSPPILENWSGRFEVPELCDVLGFLGSGILLGHWNSDRLPGDWNDPDDGNGNLVDGTTGAVARHGRPEWSSPQERLNVSRSLSI